MVAKFAPIPIKAFGAEIFKILRKITPHGDGKAGHMAGGASLTAVWQARGITKSRTVHAKCAGFAGHAFGKGTLGPGKLFSHSCRHVIGRFCHQRIDGLFGADALARF